MSIASQYGSPRSISGALKSHIQQHVQRKKGFKAEVKSRCHQLLTSLVTVDSTLQIPFKPHVHSIYNLTCCSLRGRFRPLPPNCLLAQWQSSRLLRFRCTVACLTSASGEWPWPLIAWSPKWSLDVLAPWTVTPHVPTCNKIGLQNIIFTSVVTEKWMNKRKHGRTDTKKTLHHRLAVCIIRRLKVIWLSVQFGIKKWHLTCTKYCFSNTQNVSLASP